MGSQGGGRGGGGGIGRRAKGQVEGEGCVGEER